MNKESGLAPPNPPAGGEVGFTLIELTVSFTIFIALISLTTLTFTQTLQTRRVVSDLSTSMNNIAFVTEQMAREIRTGTDFKNIAGEETIRFTNANNEQVSYKKISNGIGRCVGSCDADLSYKILTSPDVKIDNLKFILNGTKRGDDLLAPRITIIAAVAGPKGINVPLQTTISARVVDSSPPPELADFSNAPADLSNLLPLPSLPPPGLPPSDGSIARQGSFESGNLSEYRDTSQNGQSVSIVTSPVREGRYAGKFTANQSTPKLFGETGASANVRIHLLGFPAGTTFSLNNGSTFWRAISLRVPASTPTDYFYAGPEVHQGGSGGCTGPAPLNVGLTGNQWRLIIRGSNDCANNPTASIQHIFGATGVPWANGVSPTLQRDQWYDFLLGWHMAPDNTGWFEAWVNGPGTGGRSVQIVPRQNMPTSMNLNTNYPMDSLYYPSDIGGTNTLYYDGGAYSTDFNALRAWQNSFTGSW